MVPDKVTTEILFPYEAEGKKTSLRMSNCIKLKEKATILPSEFYKTY